ncbi:alpha-hydroxy acid oxidase [Georgenia alba]|uniref:Alpha-hydroxy-acid oxidizing protein n=1 Tax=Georgenia alba TaxID=2233858 RepID=A0ABW2Q957_9MICO
MRRQVPNLRDLASLLQLEAPTLRRTPALLARAADIADLRLIARRRTPRAAFDYADGAALDEIGYRRARTAFDQVEFLPRVLQGGQAEADTTTTIAGGRAALPFGIAPTGFTRFLHAEGEIAGARAAQEAGIPFALSTMGTRSVEEVAEAAPDARRWFQLYLWKDRDASRRLVERAAAGGYDTLLVTADTAVAGQRLRDLRNGMTIPPRLTARTVLDASYRPGWWFNFLTTEPLAFASLSHSTTDLPSMINSMFDPTLDWTDLAWIRSVWRGKLFVKGVLGPEDAVRAVDAGADGVVVSSHGGRQLDRAVAPLRILPAVRTAVGPDVELVLDSGILSGTDVVAALCAGADFTLVGRAYLYGLMAGGRPGVDRALQILAQEIRTTMKLLGAGSVDQLGPHLLHQGRP